jgi:hypothetical protein
MKTKQTTIHRSGAKWLPGAMALAATAASSQAATVQITLTGNKISTGGNQINADLTGDGIGDVIVQNVFYRSNRASVKFVNLGFAIAGRYGTTNNPNFFLLARLGAHLGINGIGGSSIYSPVPSGTTGLNSITFSDNRINGGSVTEAWLEVHAYHSSFTSHTVQLTRLIFDDASVTRPGFTAIPDVQTAWSPSAIPEPSSFALLGLGAAGVLARRRRQAA